jgi:hypothetical protein
MTLLATCPTCGTENQVADDLRGKAVRCGGCQELVIAGTSPPGGAGPEHATGLQTSPRVQSPAPLLPPGPDDEPAPARRPPPGPSVAAWVYGSLTGAALVAGLVVIAILWSKQPGTDVTTDGGLDEDDGKLVVPRLGGPGPAEKLEVAIPGRAPAGPPRGNPPPRGRPPEAVEPPFLVDPKLRDAAGGARVYLGDMTAFGVKTGPGRLGKGGDLGGPRPGDRITVDGTESPHGLGMHPPSSGAARARYALGKRAKAFKAGAAFNDADGSPPAPAVFSVLGDGKELWTSGEMKERRVTKECVVDVGDVDVLELRVTWPGKSDGAHAVWVEPHVEKK